MVEWTTVRSNPNKPKICRIQKMPEIVKPPALSTPLLRVGLQYRACGWYSGWNTKFFEVVAEILNQFFGIFAIFSLVFPSLAWIKQRRINPFQHFGNGKTESGQFRVLGFLQITWKYPGDNSPGYRNIKPFPPLPKPILCPAGIDQVNRARRLL